MKSLAFAAIAMATLYSCNKVEQVDPTETQEGAYTYTFTLGNADTRSTIGMEDGKKVINWEEGDQIGVYTVTTSGTSANKKGDIDIEATPNTFSIYSDKALAVNDWVYTYAPQRFMTNEGYANPATVQLDIPTTQTQDGTAFKANAMPMAGTPYQVQAPIEANTPNPVGDIKMINLGSIIDFKIYTEDSSLSSELVKSVTFNANSAIAGTFEFDLTAVNYGNAETLAIEGYSEESVTTVVSNPVALGSTKANGYDVYMVVAPGSYTGEVVVETDKAKYTFPISTAKAFNRNVILNIGVKLRQDVREEVLPVTGYEWNLVTSADQVVAGAEIVIVASDADYAMSQTQNPNNRAVEVIVKNENKISWAEDTPVQVFEIVDGSANNTVAFKCLNGGEQGKYIYAAASNYNYLRTSETLNGNASWTVTVNADYTVVLVANGTNTRNELRFNINTGGNSPMFSCYAHSSSTGTPVALYIKGAPVDPNAKSIVPCEELVVPATGGSVSFESAYSVNNIDENTETIVATAEDENITDVCALAGDVEFSMAPNYTDQDVNSSIILTLEGNEDVTATIPVKQLKSTLSVSASTVIIPFNSEGITFTVTSKEFDWQIASGSTNVSVTEAGEASENPVTVTVTSNVAAAEEEQTLATLTIYRTDDAEDDPQVKTVTVKKASKPSDVVWTLVKNVSELEDGMEIVIANAAHDYAISTTQNTNNRKAQAVTYNADVLTINSEVQIITLEASGNNWKLCVGEDQYLYAASNTSNVLKTSTSKTAGDNGVFAISISNDVASIIAQGSYSRKDMRYNPNNGSPLFTCYATSNTDMARLAIFKKVDNRPNAPISWSAAEGYAEMTAEGIDDSRIPTFSNAENLSVTFASSAPTVATIDGDGVISIVGEGTATISATYAGEGSYKKTMVSFALEVEDNRPTVATPSFSPVAGEVQANTTVTISCTTSGADIYYTTDANAEFSTSTWTKSNTVVIDAAKTIRAVAVKKNYKNSAEASAAYTVAGQEKHYYTKVTSAPTDWSGTYLIVYSAGSIAFDGSKTQDSGATFSVVIEDNKIASTAEIDAKSFTIGSMSGGYYLKSSSGKYLSGTSGSNKTNYGDDESVNTISFSNGDVLITSNTSVLRYNSVSTIFRYYKSSGYSNQNAIQLYKLN